MSPALWKISLVGLTALLLCPAARGQDDFSAIVGRKRDALLLVEAREAEALERLLGGADMERGLSQLGAAIAEMRSKLSQVDLEELKSRCSQYQDDLESKRTRLSPEAAETMQQLLGKKRAEIEALEKLRARVDSNLSLMERQHGQWSAYYGFVAKLNPQEAAAGVYKDAKGFIEKSPLRLVAASRQPDFGTLPKPQPVPGGKISSIESAMQKASTGDAYAQAVLAMCYASGWLVAKDSAKAFSYALSSARQKHPLGLYHLGVLIESGQGIEADFGEGLTLKRMAFEGLNEMAGDPCALNVLGVMCLRGDVVKANPSEAARMFRMAAQQGFAPAQYNYANCLLSGKGVPKDRPTAARYWQLARVQAYPLAQKEMP